MDWYRARDAWKKIRGLLVSDRSRELAVFLFFLMVATVFWILQTLDETLDKEVAIKVELADVPEDVIITSPPPAELKAVVSDKGTSLLHYVRYGAEPLQVPFAYYDNGASYGEVRLRGADLQRMAQGCLLGTSRIKSLSPDTIEFYYNRGLCKTVPIVVESAIETSPEYYLLGVKTTPAEVQVYAPPTVLDTLTAVRTMPVRLEGVAENTARQVGLRGIRGAKYSEDSVRLDIAVDIYVEKTASVPVHTSNFPAGKSLRTFPSEVQVVYTVGYTRGKSVKEDDFLILLTYEQILGYRRKGKSKLPLTLRNVPEGVTNARIEPREVDYLIESIEEE